MKNAELSFTSSTGDGGIKYIEEPQRTMRLYIKCISIINTTEQQLTDHE